MTYLCENRYCKFIDSRRYKKREYYLSHQNITGLSIQRISYQKKQIWEFLEKLNNLKQEATNSEQVNSEDLLMLLDQFIEEYGLLFKIYDTFLSQIRVELSAIQKKYSNEEQK